MTAFHFLRPYWLFAAVPALLIWWGCRRRQDRRRHWEKVFDPHLLSHLLVGADRQPVFRPVHLLLLMWTFAVIALAGPTWRPAPSPFAEDAAGLVVLLKVSDTMKSTDVQPSRLERAKQKLRDLLEIRQGAETGLIVYSGSAHLVMPLTTDSRIINTMVEGLSPEVMPREGDELAQAVEMAENLIADTGSPGSLLVIADAVAPRQQALLATAAGGLPMQFLFMQPREAPLDQAMKKSGDDLNAAITRFSVDSSDVESVAARAATAIAGVAATKEEQRRQDDGYLLLPLIVCCMLFWFRKGWVIL